jgi:hypothetical protein
LRGSNVCKPGAKPMSESPIRSRSSVRQDDRPGWAFQQQIDAERSTFPSAAASRWRPPATGTEATISDSAAVVIA